MSDKAESIPPVAVTRHDGIQIVDFTHSKILDQTNIAAIDSTLTALVDEEATPRLVLDFANVENLSSSALGMLIKLKSLIDARSGQLRLTNIKPQIHEVFVITNLHQRFDIMATRDQAIASIGGAHG